MIWLAILYAGADQPPPPRFVFVVLPDLVAAGLVYWRVPIYLTWIASRRHSAMLFVVLDGLIATATRAVAGTAEERAAGEAATTEPVVSDSVCGTVSKLYNTVLQKTCAAG